MVSDKGIERFIGADFYECKFRDANQLLWDNISQLRPQSDSERGDVR